MTRFCRLVRLVLDLLVVRGRRDRSKDVEILVLPHQLAILQRRSRVHQMHDVQTLATRTVQFVPVSQGARWLRPW